MPRKRYLLGIAAAAAAAVALVAGTVAANSADRGDAVTFAVVGDSITVWSGKEAGSWTSYAGSEKVYFTGAGWARNGAPLALMAQNTQPLDAGVLVVLAGTNDLAGSAPVDDRLGLIDTIVSRSGVARIVIAAVPPYDPGPALSTDWNRELRRHADDRGYVFVDAWADARTPAGAFAAGATIDGVHPTPEAASGAGASIRDAIVEAAERSD